MQVFASMTWVIQSLSVSWWESIALNRKTLADLAWTIPKLLRLLLKKWSSLFYLILHTLSWKRRVLFIIQCITPPLLHYYLFKILSIFNTIDIEEIPHPAFAGFGMTGSFFWIREKDGAATPARLSPSSSHNTCHSSVARISCFN